MNKRWIHLKTTKQQNQPQSWKMANQACYLFISAPLLTDIVIVQMCKTILNYGCAYTGSFVVE